MQCTMSISLAGLLSIAAPLSAQDPEVSIPSGANYDTARFRLWHPEGVASLRAVLVLVPGSNGDGRAEVEDARAWLKMIAGGRWAPLHATARTGRFRGSRWLPGEE